MEQGLYAQVVMIRRNGPENRKEKEKTKKYNFQGKSARSRRWFDLYHEWLKEDFMTREPYFYKNLYQISFRGDDTKRYQLFSVPIGNEKITDEI